MSQKRSRPVSSTARSIKRTTDTTQSSDTRRVCPECDTPLQNREQEWVCPECYLVVEDSPLDRGPEWLEFDEHDRTQKRRTGPPRTVLRHDNGLSTRISFRDEDAQGRSLSAGKRRQLGRLRMRNRRSKFDKADRNRAQGLSEIQRMASSLGLCDDVQETAAVLFRRAQDEDLLRGRSIESIATAGLFAAAGVHNHPRSLTEFVSVSRLDDRRKVFRAYQTVTREFELAIQPTRPDQLVPKLVSDLGVFDTTAEHRLENTADQLARQAFDDGIGTGGKSPSSVAASALYVAGATSSLRLSQRVIAKVADISTASIQHTYPDVLSASPSLNINQEAVRYRNVGPRSVDDSLTTRRCANCGDHFGTEAGLTLHENGSSACK